MGLSDEERIAKMYWAITHITETLAKLGTDINYDLPMDQEGKIGKLQKRASKLWHQFLGSKTNGAFWILGGDATNPVRNEKGGPWSAAICSLCEQHRPNSQQDFLDRAEARREYDPFRSALDIQSLLSSSRSGQTRAALYEVYCHLEFLSYGLRRYNDELRQGFKGVDKNLSAMMGLCFTFFARDEIYGRAYVLNRLLEAIYGGRYGYEQDPLGQILQEMNFHHHLSRPMQPEGSLKEIIGWDQWRLTHKDTAQNRLVLAMRIAGRRFHYNHDLDKLVQFTRGMKIHIKVIQREFRKCQKAHNNRNTENQDSYRENREWDERHAIHGYLDID